MQTEEALFEPERHEPISQTRWNEGQVRAAIEELVSDVAGARGENGYRPDQYDAPLAIYGGAGGILWASHELHRRGFCANALDVVPTDLTETGSGWQAYTAAFEEYKVRPSASFLMGPVGVLMLKWKLTGDPDLLDRLDTLIGENQSHPWMENLWGAPSTMVAASHLLKATGDERFAAHIRSGAAYMWRHLEDSDSGDFKIWNISLYGRSLKLTGAGHGFVGNVFPILKNLALLDGHECRGWTRVTINTVVQTALTREGQANWYVLADQGKDLPRRILIHQCHGAPGFVIGLMSLYAKGHLAFDGLMLAAGELIWQAGPLKKYPGLCHGTAGNGYAFLKLWKATGDEKWLTRARAFAMSAISQRNKRIEAGEASRCSLWEGDMGLAIYLADCIDGKSDFPTLDYF